jgi:hypothetical protein
LLRGVKPIDTAPMAAVPIMVKTTRRERFMVCPVIFLNDFDSYAFGVNQASESRRFHSFVRQDRFAPKNKNPAIYGGVQLGGASPAAPPLKA